jgi:hypothetical protein
MDLFAKKVPRMNPMSRCRNRTPVILAVFLVFAGYLGPRRLEALEPVAINFSSDEAGKPPAGFTTALTGGGGPIAWVVREDAKAPGGGKTLVQESSDDTSYRFPLCIYDKLTARDVSVEVKFKAVSGKVDQAAGVVLRYSPENYYIARANALEDNVNIFKTVQGKRSKVVETPVKVTAGEWHTLRFEAKAEHLTVALDGKNVIETDDATFSGPGKVGLWTKADSVTAFADLKIDSPSAAVDLDAALARASAARRPTAIFIFDPGQKETEWKPQKSEFEASLAKTGVMPLALDLSVSRNRAAAARFHITDAGTPLLVCLSPKGVIVSRDERATAVAARIAEIAFTERARRVDRKLAPLEEAVAKSSTDATAQLALADFLVAQGNAREAIPHLALIAHSEAADNNLRVRAWVALARAHLWIAEPEKGRHEASDLIAALAAKTPEAAAGGNLVHGLQDANGKRTALARREFEAAISAAPNSTYAKQAAEALAKLPKDK